MSRTPGPPTWATIEQTDLLQSYIADYKDISIRNRRYTDFWAELKEVWFGKYPAHQELYPNQALKDLTPEQRDSVTKAMDKTLQVCVESIVPETKLIDDIPAPQKLVPLEGQYQHSYLWSTTPSWSKDLHAQHPKTPAQAIRDVFQAVLPGENPTCCREGAYE